MKCKSGKLTRIIILMSLLFLTSCHIDKHYSIHELGIDMFVERIDIKNKIYRIYLLSRQDSVRNDYLDVMFPSTDMPSISIHFPVDKPDTIFVLDRWNNVKRINSANFNFILFDNESNHSKSYMHLSDSIQRYVKAVGIYIYINGICICNENKETRSEFVL